MATELNNPVFRKTKRILPKKTRVWLDLVNDLYRNKGIKPWKMALQEAKRIRAERAKLV